MGVETLEGRTLLSYLVVVKNHKAIPIETGDARDDEPLFSNGLAFKHQAHFYPFYTGPKRPELNGVQATARITGNLNNDGRLILSGTVAGPINQRPRNAAQGAIYTFAIDRGGASEDGPFPGRPRIRFDTVVVVAIRPTGTSAYVQLNNPSTNQPLTPIQRFSSIPGSSFTIQGNVITVTLPLMFTSGTPPTTTNLLPSSGKAIDQWNVNFFTRNPAQKPDFRSVASLTPEFTEFQVYVKQPTYN